MHLESMMSLLAHWLFAV